MAYVPSMPRFPFERRVAVALISTSFACTSTTKPPHELAPRPDLAATMQRTHDAFARAASGRHYEASNLPVAAKVDGDGAVQFRVVDAPRQILRLQTESIMGDPATAPTIREEQGDVLLDRDTSVERLDLTGARLEQSWSFPRRPRAEGPLAVRVRVTGLVHLAETEAGHHFADVNGQPRFSYSHATWVDADGRKTPVRARWVRDAIEMTVPAGLVAASRFPAVLDPTVQAEQAIDVPIASSFSPLTLNPAVAWGTDSYFAVWADRRIAWDGNPGPGLYSAYPLGGLDPGERQYVWGARVSASGVVLDPAGMLISTEAGCELGGGTSPAIAFGGGVFLVVYARSSNTLWANTVSPVSGVGTSFDLGMQNALAPAVAAGDGKFLVTDQSGMHRVWSPAAGFLTAKQGFGGWTGARVAASQSSFLLVGESAGNLVGARVAFTGPIIDGAPFSIANTAATEAKPDVAASGSKYLVTFLLGPAGAQQVMTQVRDGVTGNLLSSFAASNPRTIVDRPAVAWAPASSEFGLAWVDSRTGVSNLYATRLGVDGAPVTFDGLAAAPGPSAARAPALAGLGVVGTNRFLLAWHSAVGTTTRAQIGAWNVGDFFTNVGTSLTSPANEERGPQLSIGGPGQTRLAVWQDSRNGRPDIYGALVDQSGAPIGSAFGIGLSNGYDRVPAVAWSGTKWLVVWERDGNIVGRHVSSSGTPIEVDPFTIRDDPEVLVRPQVASAQGSFLVTYERTAVQAQLQYYQLGTMVVSALGVVTPGTALWNSVAPKAAVAASASGYLVVSNMIVSDSPCGGPAYANVLAGARVDPQGQLIGGYVPLDGALTCANMVDPGNPTVASNGTGWVVAWVSSTSGHVVPSGISIWARAVAADGSLPTAKQLVTIDASLRVDELSVAWAGSELGNGKYLLAWTDGCADVFGRLLSSVGVPFGSAFSIAATHPWVEGRPSVTSVMPNQWLVGFEHFIESPSANTTRARIRRVTNP